MANASFRSIPFDVYDEESFGATVRRDGDGTPRFAATILVTSDADHLALIDAVCIVSVKRPIGSLAIFPFVEAGVGQGTLTVPSKGGGVNDDYTAVMTKYEPSAHRTSTGLYTAEAEWIVTDPTPV